MIRAFWTWNPVSSGSGAFDESQAYLHNRWLFDKSVWQRLFRAMSNSGFNALFFANTHPFPFMIDIDGFPSTAILPPEELSRYKSIYHWIFETAGDYEIEPYVLFFPEYAQAESMDYAVHCTAALVNDYPELAGIVVDAENVSGAFIRETVVRPAEAARADAKLIIRTSAANLPEMQAEVLSQTGRQITLSALYTGEHLVHTEPDPGFRLFAEKIGGRKLMAEISCVNFEPFTSFSFDTASGILANLEKMKCAGFSIQPLLLYEWPAISDQHFKFQFQRDMVWYNVWGGRSLAELMSEGDPMWLERQKALLPGLQAASKILETLALYLGADKPHRRLSYWHPQFCLVQDGPEDQPRLFSLQDMLNLTKDASRGPDWWPELTNQPVRYPGENGESGVFGPEDFVGYLQELAAEAESAAAVAERRAASEKGLECFMLNAASQAALGRFWVARTMAAMALSRGDIAQMLKHMEEALTHYRLLADFERHQRETFRVRVGRSVLELSWKDVISRLEAELAAASSGSQYG